MLVTAFSNAMFAGIIMLCQWMTESKPIVAIGINAICPNQIVISYEAIFV